MEQMAEQRRYKRGERGMESMERRMLQSMRMQRLIAKLSAFYGVQLKTPGFVPVYVSKRLTAHDGLHYTSRIVIASYSTKDRKLLWHEIMHSVVSDNWRILYEEYKNMGKTLPSYHSFEKQVFRFGINDGSHSSQNWKLLCDCGMWIKTVQKKKTWTCPRCNQRLVSKNEYERLKKIASIGSTTLTFDINKYKPWKSNERIA